MNLWVCLLSNGGDYNLRYRKYTVFLKEFHKFSLKGKGSSKQKVASGSSAFKNLEAG